MALLPFLFDDFSPMHNLHEPVPRNWITAFMPEEALHPLRRALRRLAHVEQDTSITVDKDKFQANVDVQQFKPEEITVKLEGGNTVIIEAKHEEQQDEHGFISRHFVRKYVLPDDCDVQKLQSKLSSDGVLTISAPKKPEDKQVQESKHIPISFTGPVRNFEQKQNPSETKKEGV